MARGNDPVPPNKTNTNTSSDPNSSPQQAAYHAWEHSPGARRLFSARAVEIPERDMQVPASPSQFFLSQKRRCPEELAIVVSDRPPPT